MTQLSPYNLRILLERMETATKNLNDAIDRAVKANHENILAKAEVSKCTHQLNLIKEEIMSEKALLRASQ